MKQDRFLTGILIGIGVLVVVALAVFFSRKDAQTYVPDDTPEGVVYNYVLAVLNKDYEKAFVLAADTVVAVGRRVLGKAELEHEAGDALRVLRGRAHRVHTAICLLTPDNRWRERVVETRIRFRNLTNEEIGNYLASGEWKGKAGGYAIHGIAGSFVVKLVGSYTNVVGLPLTEVVSLLQGEGFPVSHLWLSKAEVETE